MCLVLEKIKKNKKFKFNADGVVMCYKAVQIRQFERDECYAARGPCYAMVYQLNSRNFIRSTRFRRKLTIDESVNGEIYRGIHVFKSFDYANVCYGYSGSMVIVPVLCYKSDLVGENNDEAVFMKVKIPVEYRRLFLPFFNRNS